MNKSAKILDWKFLIPLIILAITLISISYAEFCANVFVSSVGSYCNNENVPPSDCCPNDIVYNVTLGYPIDQQDCLDNYVNNSLDNLTQCSDYVCCYSHPDLACLDQVQADLCRYKNQSGNSKAAIGYNSDGSGCSQESGGVTTYIFSECASEPVNCSDYDGVENYAACVTSSGCYSCSDGDTCIDDCDNCSGYNRTDGKDCIAAECSADSDCPDGGYGYTCNESVCNVIFCHGNEEISTGNYGDSPYCFCGDELHPIITPEKWCCYDDSIGTISDNPCERFYLDGNVTDEKTGSPIYNAVVDLVDLNHKKISSDNTSHSGDYGINDIVTGDYKIIFSSPPNYYSKTILIKINETKRLNANLTFKNDTACDGINPPAVSKLSVNNIIGEKKLLLSWQQPNCGNIDGYYLYRNDTSNNYVYTVLPADIGLPGDMLSYLDDGKLLGNLEWDFVGYRYEIRVHYTSGITSAATYSIISQGVTYPGYSICQYVENQSSINKYNINSVCQEGTNITVCANNFPNVEESCTSSICITNFPTCVNVVEAWFDGYPFGLFSKTSNCAQNQYSFLDYSSTSIDKCSSCYQTSSCFDYKSQYACIADNCYASMAYTFNGTNEGCAWQPGYYSELGKGFCYDPDYSGQEQCGLCNKEGELFTNSNCTSQECRNLGECINVQGSCETCDLDLRCEAITSELECIGEMPFSVNYDNGFPLSMTYSDDSCNIGRCVWESGQCYKKADDINYCGDSVECKNDVIIPITSINRTIPKIHLPITGTEEEKLRFAIDLTQLPNPQYNFTYALKARDESYILSSEETSNRLINKNPLADDNINSKISESGVYGIFYYSKDNYFNLEEPNMVYAYIDNEAPFDGDLQFVQYVTDSTNATATDIYLSLSSEEYLACTYNITLDLTPINIDPSKIIEDTFLTEEAFESITEEAFFASSSLVDKVFSLEISGLPDEEYSVKITCRDNAMNLNYHIEGVGADQVHEIIDYGPKGGLLTGLLTGDEIIADLELFVETSDPAQCRLRKILGPDSFVFVGETPGYMNMSEFTDSYYFISFYDIDESINNGAKIPDGEYQFAVECDMGAFSDSAEVGFIVDTTFNITSYNPTGYTSVPQPTITLETDFSANCTINEIMYKDIGGPPFQPLSFVPGGGVDSITSKMDSLDSGLTHTKQIGMANSVGSIDNLLDKNYFVVNASCESIGTEITTDEVEFSFTTWYDGPNVGDIRIT